MIKTFSTAVMMTVGALSFGCASTRTPEPADPAMRTAAVAPAPTPEPQRIATNTQCNDWEVFFDSGSAEISPTARAVLGGLAECIQRGDVRDVSIVGSADPRGTDTENLELGRRRAEAIRGVLVARGCDPSVVRTASVGEARTSGSPETYALERHASVRTRDQLR